MITANIAIDTEFCSGPVRPRNKFVRLMSWIFERQNTLHTAVQPISLGAHCAETGDGFYWIFTDYDQYNEKMVPENKKFLAANVHNKILPVSNDGIIPPFAQQGTRQQCRVAFEEWVDLQLKTIYDKLEDKPTLFSHSQCEARFFANWKGYDMVVLTQLYEQFTDLPDHWSPYVRDVQQGAVMDFQVNPLTEEQMHNAYWDAWSLIPAIKNFNLLKEQNYESSSRTTNTGHEQARENGSTTSESSESSDVGEHNGSSE